MQRRTFLALSSTLLTVGGAGCLSGASSTTDEASERLHLKRIRVENRSDEDTLFNVDLARNGDHPYHSQLDVPSGETVTASGWTETGRTFTVVGMSKQFGNYEMVALAAEDSQTSNSLEVQFTINEQGDVEATADFVEGTTS